VKEMEKILPLLHQIIEKLDDNSRSFDEHGEQFSLIHQQLKEHSLLLGALTTGQEATHASLSELKLQNAKDFGEIREFIQNIEIDQQLLKEDSWDNKRDIRRIQQTLGMS
jgi:hypothetical protein